MRISPDCIHVKVVFYHSLLGVEAMKQNQDSQKKVESEKSLETNKCQCCGVSSPDLKKCTRCKSVYYCNKVCQKRDWKERHRNTCRPAS